MFGRVWLVAGLLALLAVQIQPARAESETELLSRLPNGETVYGLALGSDGTLYASGLGGSTEGVIFVFSPDGALRDRIKISAGPAGVASLRGLAFDSHGNLYVADLADGRSERGRIVRITPSGRQSTFASDLAAPIGLAFDRSDVLYVADGLAGTVLWIGPSGVWAPFLEDDRLKPHVSGGLGASGLAFSPDERTLYVSNAADDRLLRAGINADGSAGRLTVLADRPGLRASSQRAALEGPEGITVDSRGNLLVAASRAGGVELISAEGRALGGVTSSGTSSSTSPASLAILGRFVYVANRADGGQSHVARFPLTDLYDR